MINFFICISVLIVIGFLVKLSFDFAEIADDHKLWNSLNWKQKFVYLLFGGPIAWGTYFLMKGVCFLIERSEQSSNWLKGWVAKLSDKLKG